MRIYTEATPDVDPKHQPDDKPKIEYTPEPDKRFYDEPFYRECNMCGRERVLNSEGYCSQCWTVWNS